LIGTVRNVGYKAVRPARGRAPISGSDDTEIVESDAESFQDPLADPLHTQ
jgi:hypothetical protein